ncbi:MAG: DUF1615 family protein [Burkholderiaceae bacterium]|jgi:hypothetical protein|nr:DUF1615 family protein [Burkholderiaceae bacterium]
MLLLAALPAAPAGPPAPQQFLPPGVTDRCATALTSAPVSELQTRATALLAGRGVREPTRWAGAVLTALCASELPPDAEHVSLAFALIEAESSFNPHGLLPNQPEGFRKLGYRLIHDLLAGETTELERQMGKDVAPRVLLAATHTLRKVGLLDEAQLRTLFDRTYQRFGWQRVTTEWDIENTVTHDLLTLAEETHPLGLLLRAVLAVAPEWRHRLAEGAVLRSVGPLQVGPEAAVRLAAKDGLVIDALQARALLYTMDAGVYYGVRQITPHIKANTHRRALTADASAFIATDRWLGVLACRDAAVLHQASQLAGQALPPETRLRSPAVRPLLLKLHGQLQAPEQRAGVSPEVAASRQAQAVDRFLALAGRPQLEQDELYLGIRTAYQGRFGRAPDWALVPEARRYYPKTGSFTLRQLADAARQRFIRNCVALECRGT